MYSMVASPWTSIPSHLIEGACLAGSGVYHCLPRSGWCAFDWRERPDLGKEQIHASQIADKDKIAPLLAVAVSARSLEQTYVASLENLLREVVNHGGHPVLVGLARSIDIEVSEPDHRDRDRFTFDAMAQIVVEGQLRESINVKGLFVFQGGGEVIRSAQTIDGGCGSVDKRRSLLDCVIEDFPGAGKVIVHHVDAVIEQGVGACALMKDRSDPWNPETSCGEGSAEHALVHVVDKTSTVQIEELAGVGKVVDDENVGDAIAIQFMNEIAAEWPNFAYS